MIEVVSAERCIACDKCVLACPTNVFDTGADGVPVIARQDDCQTCFMCEAYCPVDALFVAPTTHPAAPEGLDEAELAADGRLGSYRAHIGWGRGRTPGARLAVGPELPGAARMVAPSVREPEPAATTTPATPATPATTTSTTAPAQAGAARKAPTP
ncbi:4Fe-4S dicluster domain-containing protein [Streptomyces sp. 3MP-14]|uniref:4Fe-4S dicluster domain-containing protein n=1 Tax=Streptomyces mimosae TaxID=2586635 RepID=A0A5N5ZQB1_9ACTN|nr:MULTISPECIES: ferredoxin family protein [Streptomyces]KAB8157906.1 4Fe-4S dicluster domain-containing protein [Streptomyces mimosae]KAB8172407.1 4Fe-4S dicluster domain-containing protein [Streptomyces sp. 3MP-14]